MQSKTIQDQEKWNEEEKILLHIPTQNASKGVGNLTTISDPIMNSSYRSAQLQFIQSTTIRGYENLIAEGNILLHVPTLKASEGVGNVTTMDISILNSYINPRLQYINPLPSEAIRIGMRKKKYFPEFQLSSCCQGSCWKLKNNRQLEIEFTQKCTQ